MKRFLKSLTICFVTCLLMFGAFVFSGCDFSVDYKSSSTKLNEAIKKLDESKSFSTGIITVKDQSFTVDLLPKVSENFINDTEYYSEIDEIYNSMFSYVVEYIKEYAMLLATPPTVESLTEAQENLYKSLQEETELFGKSVEKFSTRIEEINKFYDNLTNHGENSKEVFVLNYKKAYRDFIYDCFDLANSIEDITGSVYQEIQYEELKDKKGKVFKSLERGINIRIFEGYFSFIVDSFDCRLPQANIDANEYMFELLDTYAVSRENYLDFYVSLKISETNNLFIKDEIESIKSTIVSYFEETELFQNAYDMLEFEKFYFDDDCALDRYIEEDFSNKNHYGKINDYINNTLPNLTKFVESKFFA